MAHNHHLYHRYRKVELEKYLNIFNIQSFRHSQKEVIEYVLSGKSCLFLSGTGSGKSLCYQLPCLINGKMTIVISPLIALMNEQAKELKNIGINAEILNSQQQPQQMDNVQILYTTPEQIQKEFFRKIRERIGLIAIDEAHCLSQWGHDFRPSYRKLERLNELFRNIPRLALTASARRTTEVDIMKTLNLSKCFRNSLTRHNIFYDIEPRKKGDDQLLNFTGEHEGESGIIYCQTRRQTEIISHKLQKKGLRAICYHAGQTPAQRNYTENFFRENNIIVVSTIAFGLGINKPDIRYVYHYNMPKSIENYYQETGRAGRDGKLAIAKMTWNRADFIILNELAKSSNEKKKLNEMLM